MLRRPYHGREAAIRRAARVLGAWPGPGLRGAVPSAAGSNSAATTTFTATQRAGEDSPPPPPLPCAPGTALDSAGAGSGPSTAVDGELALLLRILPTSLVEVVLDLGRPPYARFPPPTGDVPLSRAPLSEDDIRAAVAQVGPGVGKTTALREVCRIASDAGGRRVVVVDTSNEVGGDGDVPHPSIGGARRMQVPRPEAQHAVMVEAVENHMPQVVVIDEMSTTAECAAARTIAQRGVQLVATAHGGTLANLVKNPTLADLVGGVQTVTLGDEEARRRGSSKSVLERAGPPTFDVAVEMEERGRWRVHLDLAAAVDSLLAAPWPGWSPAARTT
ncbi:hypothetical protein GPECTOR_397g222 [Gonium pectorale]|uniref:Stage III sporulation protein AA AAA+ ATPase domain-containing protein n=1 Tax=Gonium pectorale TaxID=33097 RepID=A0A150FVA6_GONPE|nr:hypothetical protein GPECTOR_397g222 [Gonium pectorale]|eukprot:KXZ41553.1 hypothetical protein GPECTOR_397g222 [Gonium pectorale]